MTKIRDRIHKQLTNLSKADLHIHSDYSDAYCSIEEILEHVENKTDLMVIAITDHDTIDGALYAKEIAKDKSYRFDIIVGEEVSSREGHILGLFLSERIPPKLSAHETIARINEQGGIAIPAHPLYHSRFNNNKKVLSDGVGALTLLQEKDNYDAIETVNATPMLGSENLKVKYMNRTLLFKTEVGNSDAHIVNAIGKGYTLFEGTNGKDLREAIESHQTQAMNYKWNVFGIGRYGFFFLPRAVRTAFYTLIFGPRRKRPEIINFPSRSKLKKELTVVDSE